jgi:hypothetical protein
MSLITTHCSGASARRSRCTVKGPLRVGKCALKFGCHLRRRGAYAEVAAFLREGHWEGSEAEPVGSFSCWHDLRSRGPRAVFSSVQ